MKRLFYVLVAAFAVVFAFSCEKDTKKPEPTPVNPTDKIIGQWQSEEMRDNDNSPLYRLLMDVGTGSGEGEMTMAYLIVEDFGEYKAGDILGIWADDYTYDSGSGELVCGENNGTVEFVSEDAIILRDNGIGLDFTRVDPPYSLENIIWPGNEEEEEFVVTPSKEADWAGGEITWYANKEIKYMTYNAIFPEDGRNWDVSDLCPTTLNDGVLGLGLYTVDGEMVDCDIFISAQATDGTEYGFVVTSDCWKPVLYIEKDGEYEEVVADTNGVYYISRGATCYLGAVNSLGENIAYIGEEDTFGGISYNVPNWVDVYGNDGNLVVCDMPNTNDTGTITLTYGNLTYTLKVEISE